MISTKDDTTTPIVYVYALTSQSEPRPVVAQNKPKHRRARRSPGLPGNLVAHVFSLPSSCRASISALLYSVSSPQLSPPGPQTVADALIVAMLMQVLLTVFSHWRAWVGSQAQAVHEWGRVRNGTNRTQAQAVHGLGTVGQRWGPRRRAAAAFKVNLTRARPGHSWAQPCTLKPFPRPCLAFTTQARLVHGFSSVGRDLCSAQAQSVHGF